MAKELSVRMEKAYDLVDGTAEKYDFLAYFKEQEAAKNRILNDPLSAMPITATLSGYNTTNRSAAKAKSASDSKAQDCLRSMIAHHEFTITDLLLCYIAFFLFVLIIAHD